MYTDDIGNLITMDYMDVVCNGKSTAQTINNSSSGNKNQMQLNRNINWLIHLLYTREEYQYCNQIIAHQLLQNYDKEYLYFIKGLIERKEDNQHESLRYLQKSIELNPSNYINFKEIGITLFTLGRWKQALEVFLKAESLLPRHDPQIYHYIGDLLYHNIGNICNSKIDAMPSATMATVKEYYIRAIQSGKQLESYEVLAEIYKRESNFTKAIEMLESTIQIVPDNPNILTEIGILYLKINDTKGAFKKLIEVTRMNRKFPKALIALGAILQSKNDVDGALNKYKIIIESDQENNTELWNNIGLCFYKKKKYIASIACLKKSVWMSPLNFNCLYNLGLVYLSAHQFGSAYYTFAAAVNIRPDHAECYMLIGVCLKHLNDAQNTFLAIERAAMLPEAIKNPLIYLNASIYCFEQEKIETATLFLGNFFDVTKTVKIREEYIHIANELNKQLLALSNNENSIDDTDDQDTTKNN